MRKKFVHIALFVVCILSALARVTNGSDVAKLKYTLPEFRDISVWKGRPGLTRFSPDGKYVAVSGKTTDVVIYSTETGELICKIDGSGFRAFSFSPNGKFAVTQDTLTQLIRIYDVETGKLLREFRGLGKMAFMSKSLGGSGLINELNGIWPISPVFEMGHVSVTRNWQNVLINKNDKEFAIYNFDSGDLRFDIEHEKYNSALEKAKFTLAILGLAAGSPGGFLLMGSASNARFSEDGNLLLIANGNKTPTLWNVESGTLIAKIEAGERVFHTRFSPNGKMFATSDFRGVTKVWNAASGELISTIGTKKEAGIAVGWDGNSDKILIQPVKKGDLRAYDSNSSGVYQFSGSNPKAILLSPDSLLLLTIPKKDKTILFQLWTTATGQLIATARRTDKHRTPLSIKFSPDSSIVATSTGIKDAVELWGTKGELIQVLEHSTMPMEFSEDGKYLATGGVLPNSKIDAGYLWELSK
jgi:WD40 repeat protein